MVVTHFSIFFFKEPRASHLAMHGEHPTPLLFLEYNSWPPLLISTPDFQKAWDLVPVQHFVFHFISGPCRWLCCFLSTEVFVFVIFLLSHWKKSANVYLKIILFIRTLYLKLNVAISAGTCSRFLTTSPTSLDTSPYPPTKHLQCMKCSSTPCHFHKVYFFIYFHI